MAHDGPSSLPTFYGEKTPEGRLVKRTADEDEVMATSPPMSQEKAPIPTRESAFGPEPPTSGNRARWSLDDARREEYWKGYWDRKRQEREIDRERESHWYPDYRGPMRFIEYPEEEEKGRGVPRSASRRDTRPTPPRPSTRARRSFEAEALPSKRAETEYGDDYVEMIYPEGRGRSKRTPPPPRVPRYKASFDSASISMRLPFLSWMGNTLKSRMFCSLGRVTTSLRYSLRFCGSSRRICGHNHVLVFRFRRNSGCQRWRKE